MPEWSATRNQHAQLPGPSTRPEPTSQLANRLERTLSLTPRFQPPHEAKTLLENIDSVKGPVSRDAGPRIDDGESDDSDGIDVLESFRQPITDLERPERRHSPVAQVSVPHRPSPAAALKVSAVTTAQVTSPSTKFQLVVPLSQDKLPLHLRPDWKQKRQRLLEELKQNKSAPDERRLAEVEQYFGQTGFSAAFGTDDTDRLLRAAPKKLRQISREDVQLEWGRLDPHPHLDSDSSNFDMSSLLHPIEQVKQVLAARFDETHDPPLIFANKINDRRLNGKFQFVSQYVLCQGVCLADARLNSGCSCPDGECNPLTCHCLPRATDLTNIERHISTYDSKSSNDITVLNEIYMLNEMDPAGGHFEISECNELCSCGPGCWNRVVSRGRTVPLEIFETAKCGFGVRSSVDIVRGQFIELYLGEVITQQELERRENAEEENQSSYIYSLDWLKGQDCHHVDGENFGTAVRFVNHSCDPNARSFTVISNKADKNVYYLAFFAIKNINAGAEICIDYSPQMVGDDEQAVEQDIGGDRAEADARARCYCGAERIVGSGCGGALDGNAGSERRRSMAKCLLR